MQLKAGELFYTSISNSLFGRPNARDQIGMYHSQRSMNWFNIWSNVERYLHRQRKERYQSNGTPNVDQATQAEHIPTSYIVAAKPRKTTAANAAAET